jgi:hypothetical protein
MAALKSFLSANDPEGRMTVTQTVEIPDSHRLTIDVPREVPAGKVILAFTPAEDRKSDNGVGYEGKCPICAANRDPVTGNPRYNAETIAGMQEVEDMISGKIPAKWYKSLDEMWEDLTAEDGLSKSDD